MARSRPPRRRRPSGPEALEDRSLPATVSLLSGGLLDIVGTARADSVQVSASGSQLVVSHKVDTAAAVTNRFALSAVKSIRFAGLLGNDTFANQTAIACSAT